MARNFSEDGLPDDHSLVAPAASCPRLSVVTPCYNEESSLDELYRRVSAACQEVVGSDYEFVLVNDGSRDRTWLRMMLVAENDPT
jgi:cellulose synthase/poly-beta-1,6-N-acetylglucosamine synthase-like glycosyltransferase